MDYQSSVEGVSVLYYNHERGYGNLYMRFVFVCADVLGAIPITNYGDYKDRLRVFELLPKS